MQGKPRDHLDLLCDVGELASLLSGSENIEGFLHRAAVMVSRHFRAEVCSIYLFEEKTSELVLRATIGLNPQAVGKIRMKMGEGLVGTTLLLRKALREGSASRNPRFKYFEEADEERFESFLAVPIQKSVTHIGVLVLQHEDRDYFDHRDEMALRAIASQLAGSIENARLLMDLENLLGGQKQQTPLEDLRFLRGETASPGVALAPSTVFRRPHSRIFEKKWEPEGPFTLAEFQGAVAETEKQLLQLQQKLTEQVPEGAALIFSAHFMMLKDPRFIPEMIARIRKGTPPPDAIRDIAGKYSLLLQSSPQGYIREKAKDIEDVAGRMLRNLLRKEPSETEEKPEGGFVVIASDLYPSEVMKLASRETRAILLVSGGVQSHVSILARSLQIPLVIINRTDLLHLPEDTPVLVDADTGNVYVQPSEKIISRFEDRRRAEQSIRDQTGGMETKTHTADGTRIHLMANINLLGEVELAKRLHAEGIGLYRTEFPFLIRSNFPSEEEQYVIYRKLFEAMPGREITVRTLDIGGEKVLHFLDETDDANPELGLRSIRFSLRHPEIFETQIRALLRAGSETPHLRILFPMISSLDEFQAARSLVRQCILSLEPSGLPYHDRPQIGAMAELPAIIGIIGELADEADFVSIGTNDFIQYMLAVDRSNEKVADYYIPYHPAVLRGLNTIAEAMVSRGKDLSVCGEMANDEALIPFLLGIGIRKLSVDPQFLRQTQAIVSRIDLASANRYALRLLAETSLEKLRAMLGDVGP